MSRAIKLTRIHALNWYGYNDTLSVDGNLLLAGVTGSGKSVLMDLIMTVLVGTEAANHHFNRSATGKESSRTLKSYCLLDTKREENGMPQYVRRAAITYIALEFTWPAINAEKARVETWGLRVEFRNTAENNGHIKAFMCDGALTKADFLDNSRIPLEFPTFRRFIEKERSGHIFESQDTYLRDMANERHLNFNRTVLTSLLPQAMSFTNLKSFDEFCRRFILPDDKLNVENVVSSYRSFKAYERDLAELFDQQKRLEEIRDLHNDHASALRDKVVARWLSAQLTQEHSAAVQAETERKLATERAAYETELSRIAELDRSIEERGNTINREIAALKELPNGGLYLELKEQQKHLTSRISQLRAIGDTVDSALRNRVRNAREWMTRAGAAPTATPVSCHVLEIAITKLEKCSIAETEAALASVASEAEAVCQALSRAIRPTQQRLSGLRDKKGSLREEIALLERGQLPFPTLVLNALNEQLPAEGRKPAAQPLCKLCEVRDEEWRPAVEVAFTRKFAIVVSQQNYPAALAIYRTLKGDSPQESLINPAKALALKRPVTPDSLAEKLRTEHPVAESIISRLFGDLKCVNREEDFAMYESAILKDGFMSRGAFVERRRHYDGIPFVGIEGLKKQLALKQCEFAALETEERQLSPAVVAVQTIVENASEFIPNHQSLLRDLFEARQLPAIQQEFKKTNEKLNSIDRESFEAKDNELANLQKELADWVKEQRELLQSQKKGEIDRLTHQVNVARGNAERAAKTFERVQLEEGDISIHAGRIAEWRNEVLQRYPALDVAAAQFEEERRTADKSADVKWERLKAARVQLALVYHRFAEFLADSSSNKPWTDSLAQIAAANIPEYKAKAEAERKRWEQLFRNNVLQRMDQALREVSKAIVLLNEHLKQPIGNDRYWIDKKQNPDYRLYRQLVDLNAQFQDDGLFYQAVQDQLADALSRFLDVLTDPSKSAEAEKLLDCRRYFDYQLYVSDARDPEAKPISVDKQSGKMSGGENQSPYFVAIIASYLRAYKRHERRWKDPSLALVPIDEAFSKMDTGRIKDCIGAIIDLDLQGVFSMSTGNVPSAFSLCDQLIVVSRHEERRGNGFHIRNVPVTILRESEDGKRWMLENS